jgi:multimeric flavodoxin WrbA
MVDVRKGMPSSELSREEFERRFRSRFADPAFETLKDQIGALIDAAWDGYSHSRKSPRTRRAGDAFADPGHIADPNYELAVDWLNARAAVDAAQRAYEDMRSPRRVLLINGSSRSDQTCPGEISKTWRLCNLARETLRAEGVAVVLLDLSRLASEMGRRIHPCKACVSTAMPLCHWPCSCYPNYALEQTNDWMNEIYPLWVAAHGIMIITPVNWYQVPGGLKLMMDRLVCADGGNPDPTSTHGKNAEEAKSLELSGWQYPKHLAGRLFSVVVHGDSIGSETLRRALSDWLTDMDLTSAGSMAEKDGYIGYEAPYATSHAALDDHEAFQNDVRTAALTLARAVELQRQDRWPRADDGLRPAILK